MPHEDGEKLLELLAQPRQPVPVRTPRKRIPRRKPVQAREQTSLEVTDERPTTAHRELVWKLIQLGKTLSCDVWVASDERGKSYEGQSFADHVLAEFPSVGLDPESRDLVRGIDVLWIKGRSVVAAFEVEATTSVYSGLLRMSDRSLHRRSRRARPKGARGDLASDVRVLRPTSPSQVSLPLVIEP
jgi:hypothetical protein